jgi:hypothetical protein
MRGLEPARWVCVIQVSPLRTRFVASTSPPMNGDTQSSGRKHGDDCRPITWTGEWVADRSYRKRLQRIVLDFCRQEELGLRSLMERAVLIRGVSPW